MTYPIVFFLQSNEEGTRETFDSLCTTPRIPGEVCIITSGLEGLNYALAMNCGYILVIDRGEAPFTFWTRVVDIMRQSATRDTALIALCQECINQQDLYFPDGDTPIRQQTKGVLQESIKTIRTFCKQMHITIPNDILRAATAIGIAPLISQFHGNHIHWLNSESNLLNH